MSRFTRPRFQVLTHSCDNHLRYELIDTTTGESVSILPFLGGMIHSIRILAGTSLIETLDGYTCCKDAHDNLESSFKGSNLFPFPNRIAGGHYSFGGNEYQLPINFPHEQNAIHGLVYDKQFTVCGTREGDNRCTLSVRFDSTGEEEGFPFSYTLSHEYSLDCHKGFCCQTRIHNNSETSMPAGHGWHPYFTAGAACIDELLFYLPAREILEVNTVNIPTGRTITYNNFTSSVPVADTSLDSCFLLEDRAKHAVTLLHNTRLDLTLRLWQETGPGKYNYLQIYTPPHRKSIAIEPMTCAPDAFNNGNGLITISPGESITASWGISFKESQEHLAGYPPQT